MSARNALTSALILALFKSLWMHTVCFLPLQSIGHPWPLLCWQLLNVEDELERRNNPTGTQVINMNIHPLRVWLADSRQVSMTVLRWNVIINEGSCEITAFPLSRGENCLLVLVVTLERHNSESSEIWQVLLPLRQLRVMSSNWWLVCGSVGSFNLIIIINIKVDKGFSVSVFFP